MDMDQAAVFLAGSILFGLGIICLGITILVLNNIFHKYWKPVRWSILPSWAEHPQRFATDDELQRISPTLTEQQKK